MKRPSCPGLVPGPTVDFQFGTGPLGVELSRGFRAPAPYFEWEEKLKKIGAAVLSITYGLYGNIWGIGSACEEPLREKGVLRHREPVFNT